MSQIGISVLRALVTTERECNGKSVGSVDDGCPVPTSRIAADLKRSRDPTLANLTRPDAGDYIERSTAAGQAYEYRVCILVEWSSG